MLKISPLPEQAQKILHRNKPILSSRYQEENKKIKQRYMKVKEK